MTEPARPTDHENDEEAELHEASTGFASRIGKELVDSGKLTESDIKRILTHARKKRIRFGEAAVKLGILTKADLEQALAAQFDFSYVSDIEKTGLSPRLIAAYKPFTPAVEALRALRVELMLGAFGEQSNALAIVSPGAREGRSFVAANLAIVFSQLGERVLLVDAHMQKPEQAKLFGINDSWGLSSELSGRARTEAATVRIPHLENLHVLPAGPRPPNPAELLARQSFVDLTHELSTGFDVTIFDTPPGSTSTAADWVAARSGKALIVARRDVTRYKDLEAFVRRMRSRAQVVGTVFNRF